MPARFWRDLTTDEFRSRNMARTIAVLPLAAVEQHGPHLPTGTDAIIAGGYVQRFADASPESLDVLVLPVQEIGVSTEHLGFPGTLTLPPEAALRAWMEIGRAVYRAGCRKLVVVSSHGGNGAIATTVAQELRAELGMLVVTTAWVRLSAPDGLLAADEIRHGIHGGDVETSLMLALAPGAVRRELARDFTPATVRMDRQFRVLSAGRPAAFAWMAQDLHPSGAIGNAANATAETGERLLAHGVAVFIELLGEVDRFELPPGS